MLLISELLQVLVIHLGDRQWSWVHRSEVLPFDRNAKAKLQEVEAAIATKKLTKPCVFRKAMEVRCLPGNAAGSYPGALVELQFSPWLSGSSAMVGLTLSCRHALTF